MRILFDQGTPRPLRQHLRGHSVDVPYEMGWSELTNGELLTRADNAGYDLETISKLGEQPNPSFRRRPESRTSVSDWWNFNKLSEF